MRLILLIAGILLLAGCRDKESIPAGVMPKEKMQQVLWDMMRADQFLTNYILRNDTTKNRNDESIKLYQQVLAINRVSKEDLQKSLDYYKARPALMKEIMDSISRPLVSNAPTLPTDTQTTPKPVKEEQIVPPVRDTIVKSYIDTSKKIFRDTSRRRPKLIQGN